MTRPPALVGDPGPDWPAPGWTVVDLADLPPAPFDLTAARLAVHAALSPANATGLLLAAARGVAVAVTTDASSDDAAAFLDDLGRVAEIAPVSPSSPPLSADQRALLTALVAGASIGDAAAALGMSRRTATRRLADARTALGATTTAQAVAAFDRLRRATRLGSEV